MISTWIFQEGERRKGRFTRLCNSLGPTNANFARLQSNQTGNQVLGRHVHTMNHNFSTKQQKGENSIVPFSRKYPCNHSVLRDATKTQQQGTHWTMHWPYSLTIYAELNHQPNLTTQNTQSQFLWRGRLESDVSIKNNFQGVNDSLTEKSNFKSGIQIRTRF